nr:DUF5107 domain-containing protein [uncultured Sphaerochaeta sp.]
MHNSYTEVSCWTEMVTIPTYGVGKPEKNPMFFEKRVYQGSSGKVYPYQVIESISDEKEDVAYEAVFLENDYLRIMILPQLGGRIQRAYDKTIGYDFVYYNEVIKPALVGLLGPWISGGIEFNWPQHHRPTTFSPVDYTIVAGEGGKKTVRLGEVDQMYGTKSIASISLYPDKAYVEIEGQLYNPTPFDQTFLWWANPAVAVHDDTQSIFPPDVTAVFDHGKRDVSSFPIAHGVYYKHSYAGGVDISRYKNLPVPTSYMAWRSSYDFVGGYDYAKQAGILHIADHHLSPGKKQWTWGCGDFGKAWDRNLTDANGPYIELMTGVYTDNQPDFTWLKPYEEKTFTQYFLPYHQVGSVSNASLKAVLGLEKGDGEVVVRLYAPQPIAGAVLTVSSKDEELFSEPVGLGTAQSKQWTLACTTESMLSVRLVDSEGIQILAFNDQQQGETELPEPAKPALDPKDIASCEELWLTALHLEQYRHATFTVDPYYREGLARDPSDSRLCNSYGLVLMKRGLFIQAEELFRRAISRLQARNPNPQDSEPLYHLGLCLLYQGRDEEAYDWFYKATWSKNQQEMAFFHLGCLACKKSAYEQALFFAERSLVKNSHSLHARFLKAKVLQLLGRDAEGEAYVQATLELDPFAYASGLLLSDRKEVLARMGDRVSSFLEAAQLFMLGGWYREAYELLDHCPAVSGALAYYQAYCLKRLGEDPKKVLATASSLGWGAPFAHSLEDMLVLSDALLENPKDSEAAYQLGNLLYDKRRYEEAVEAWEQSRESNPNVPMVWRNLALAYYNKQGKAEKALEALTKAFSLDESDSRICMELDQLHKKVGRTPQQRLSFLSAHLDLVSQRDDLYTEYVALLNLTGACEQAYEMIMGHTFHPWEGGEGKITREYVLCLSNLAFQALGQGEAEKARSLLQKALVFPANLGEGKLEGQKDNDLYYLLGQAERMLGNEEQAVAYFTQAAIGSEEPANMMYYNDQPADMIYFQALARRALGDEQGAQQRLQCLVDYAQKHQDDHITIDYFAVSLPDLQIFEDDLDRSNQANCFYLLGLGWYGLGKQEEGKTALQKALALVPCHQGAGNRLGMLE